MFPYRGRSKNQIIKVHCFILQVQKEKIDVVFAIFKIALKQKVQY
eukprot:UN02450